MNTSMRFDISKFERAIAHLGEQGPRAGARALNRAAGTTRTFMARSIAADTKLKVGVVREQVKVEQARPTPDRLKATISVSGKRIPLIDFGARGPEPSRGRGRGVTARLPGGKGRYPNAFIARMKSGHRGVFQRRGKGRTPIYELFGPSLPRVFTKFMAEGLRRGQEALMKNMAHELRFALKRVA